MEKGDKVRVIRGEHEGKVGKVERSLRTSQFQILASGRGISMEVVKTLWVIKFENKEQEALEETDIEIITPQ